MIRVKSLGSIVPSAAFVLYAQGKPVLVPAGYEMERPIFTDTSAKDRAKGKKSGDVVLSYKPGVVASQQEQEEDSSVVTFTASIREGTLDAGATKTPEYVITRSDDPQNKRYVSDKTINAAWRSALEEVEKDFPDKKDKYLATRDGKGQLQVNGGRLFALSYADVQAEIRGLAGAAEALAAFPGPSTSATKGKASQGGDDDAEVEMEIAAPLVDVDAGDGDASQGTRAKRSPREKGGSGGKLTAKKAPAAAPIAPPTTRKRSRTASAAPTTTQDSEVEDVVADGATADGTTAAPPAKRSRKPGAKKSGASVDIPPTGGAAAGAAVCPDCGLSGTPFCAATGKAHSAPSACALCGLTTAFCPVSGQPHVRPNRQRGEVHLPGKKSSSRKRKASATPSAAAAPSTNGVSEVTVVVASQDGGTTGADGVATKPTRGKRTRKTGGVADNSNNGTVASEDGAGGAAPAAKKPRGKRGAGPAKAAASASAAAGNAGAGALGEGQTTLDASLVPLPPAQPEEPPKPKEYEYPPLRPSLSHAEQHRAANLQAKLWKEKSEQGVCPPHVAALHLPLVAYRPPRQAATAGTGKKRRQQQQQQSATKEGDDRAAEGEEESGQDGEHGEDGGWDAEGVAKKTDAEEGENCSDEEGAEEDKMKNEDSESVASTGRKAKKAAPLPTIMIHPLEVRDAATSAAGKRLLKFLQQYTSERTKGDILRSAESEKKAAATAKKTSKATANATKDGTTAAGEGPKADEEDVAPAPSPHNNGEPRGKEEEDEVKASEPLPSTTEATAQE